MDSRLGEDASSVDDADSEPIVRSRQEKIIHRGGMALTALCAAAFYAGKSYNQPAWVSATEGALGVLASLVAGQAYGGYSSWKEAFANAYKPLTQDILLTAALMGAVGYIAYDSQHELNIRNVSPPKYEDPEQRMTRSTGEFILGFEVCEGKQAGDRVDVSKYFPDKTRWHFTVCPK